MSNTTTSREVSRETGGGCRRRDILVGAAGLAATVLEPRLMSSPARGGSPHAVGHSSLAATTPSVVRLLSVPTVNDGGMWSELLPAFTSQTGIQVSLQIADQDLYDRARLGQADLVFSHYGHKDVSAFVLGGFGRWPRTVMFNLVVLLGPPADPANVRGLSDLTEAFRRIAASGSTYEVNGIPELVYMTKIVLQAGGIAQGAWYLDEALREAPAVQQASARGAYTLWGVTPFLVLAGQQPLQLEPLVTADSILQRIMVAIVVEPATVPGVDDVAAGALSDFLLSPAAQAQIRAFRHPQLGIPIFFPAGRDNEAAILPL